MSAASEKVYAVEMQGISKYFGSFCALNGVQLSVEKGSIHALLGENGAGKSTLMNVLYGLYQADEGEIRINGQKAVIKNPNTAIKLGIGMVHQHFMLVEPFTVTQNIMLRYEKKQRSGGVIDEAATRKECTGAGGKIRPAPWIPMRRSRIFRWACSSVWRSSRLSTAVRRS